MKRAISVSRRPSFCPPTQCRALAQMPHWRKCTLSEIESHGENHQPPLPRLPSQGSVRILRV